MDINSAFPSKWLKSGDLGDSDLTLTITHVVMEEIGQGTEAEEKPIVYFQEEEKGLVLNKTNADTISRLYGHNTDGWIGKPVTLFSTEVDFKGSQTLAIRVRLRAPKAGRAETAVPAAPPFKMADFMAAMKTAAVDLDDIGLYFLSEGVAFDGERPSPPAIARYLAAQGITGEALADATAEFVQQAAVE